MSKQSDSCIFAGTVKWFNEKKGYGFIGQEGKKPDLFVHYSNIVAEGYKTLFEGDKVEYQIGEAKGKSQAVKVRKISS